MTNSTPSPKTTPYVRLAPTTLFRAPECYGDYDRILRPIDLGYPSSYDQCHICPVRLQCSSGQPAEMRGGGKAIVRGAYAESADYTASKVKPLDKTI